MCNCNRVIQPNEKLASMLNIFKIILGLCAALMVGKAIFWIVSKMQLDLFTTLFTVLILVGTMFTLFYAYLMMGIFFMLFRVVSCGISLATLIQRVILTKKISFTTIDYWVLSIITFELILLIFAIFICFPIYKEMKAIYQGNAMGGGASNYRPPSGDVENQAPRQNVANNNSSSNFRAFGGQGVAVGGN